MKTKTKKYHRWTKEEVKAIKAERRRYSLVKVAKKFKTSPSNIYRLCTMM